MAIPFAGDDNGGTPGPVEQSSDKHRRCMSFWLTPQFTTHQNTKLLFWFWKKKSKKEIKYLEKVAESKMEMKYQKTNGLGPSYNLSATGRHVYWHATCFANLILLADHS